MIYKENEEKYAVKIITDYLKEEKNIQIKKVRHLTKGEGQPPDCYFEIGDHKIGCEVRHFDLGKKGIKLAEETGKIGEIVKRVQRDLHKKGIPPLCWRMGFEGQPKETRKKCKNDSKYNHNDAQRISHRQRRIQTERLRHILRFILRQQHRLHSDYIHRPARRGKYR